MLKIKRKRIHQNDVQQKLSRSIKTTSHSYVLFNKRLLKEGDKLKFDLFYHNKPTHMTLFLQSNTIIDVENKKIRRDRKCIYS